MFWLNSRFDSNEKVTVSNYETIPSAPLGSEVFIKEKTAISDGFKYADLFDSFPADAFIMPAKRY